VPRAVNLRVGRGSPTVMKSMVMKMSITTQFHHRSVKPLFNQSKKKGMPTNIKFRTLVDPKPDPLLLNKFNKKTIHIKLIIKGLLISHSTALLRFITVGPSYLFDGSNYL
jgi:hypothetical protein